MIRSLDVLVWLGIGTLLVGMGACGDNRSAEQEDAAVQQDAVAEDAPTGTVSVYVVSGLSVATWTGVAGASVVIDKPDGTREEQLTGSDGRITFTGIDFSQGKAAVTAYKAGTPPTSQVGITADSGEVLLYLWVFDAARPTVDLSGTAQNLHAATDRLWVTATNSTGYSEAVGASWTMPVWSDVPFTLVAVDYTAVGVGQRGYTRTWYSWVALEREAVTAATTVDIDFGQPTTPKQATGTMVLPTRAESPLRSKGMGHVVVTAWESLGGTGLGACSSSKLSADATKIEYTVDWIEPAGVQTPVTQYYLATATTGSIVLRAGYPTGGALDATFIDVPLITAAPDPTAGQNLHGEIAWQVFDPDVWMRCFVDRDGKVAWVVVAPPAETSLRIPQGPSTLDEATLLGDGDLTGYCQAIEWNLSSDWIERGATGATFSLHR